MRAFSDASLSKSAKRFFPGIAGIVPLTVLYATLGTAPIEPLLGIGLIVAPFYTIPLILLGTVVGLWFDRRSRSRIPPA